MGILRLGVLPNTVKIPVNGYPSGTYGIKYTTASQYDLDLLDQAIGVGEAVVARIPAAGVLTVYAKSTSSDTEAPSVPTDLIANAISASEVSLSWVTSVDNIAVAGCKIYRDGIRIAFSATNSYTDMSAQPSTRYTYHVSAYDTAGNESDPSLPVTVATTGYDLEMGLVGYWRFDDSERISVVDSSGNNNIGTVVGPVFVTGKTGYGLDFDGIDDYVWIAVTPVLDNLKAVTMAAWIFPRVDSHWHVLDKWDGDKRIYAEGANLTLNGRIRYTGTHAYSESTSGTIRLNTWQHVALTWSTSDHRTRLYHNGIEVAYGVHDTGSGSVLDDTTHPYVIGARGALGVVTFFDGVIDEVRLYDRALNAQEAWDLYNDASANLNNTRLVGYSKSYGNWAMSTTTKKELIDRIAEDTQAKQTLIKATIQSFLEKIIAELAKSNRLEFRDFGVFEPRDRKPRTAQNPKTPEQIHVPAKRTVKFKANWLTRQKLNGQNEWV